MDLAPQRRSQRTDLATVNQVVFAKINLKRTQLRPPGRAAHTRTVSLPKQVFPAFPSL